MEYSYSEKIANLKPSAIREIFKSLSDPTIISFSGGNPSPLSFPTEEMAKISADIYAKSADTALQYSVTEGYPPLREALRTRLKSKFGIGGEEDDTIVVSGGTQGIELACKILCNEGDVVVCEDPTFIGALNAFRSNGARVAGVPAEGEGIDTDALEAVLSHEPRAKMLYLIPTFHNPMGTTMSEEKRHRVYDICRRHGVIIFEDNPYGELRFAGEDIPNIKSFDTEGIVIYCSTFSKILSAGMRVGYVTAPKDIIQKMVVAKQVEDVHTNIFFQMVTYRYMTEYDLDAHIADIRALYRHKAGLMLSELDHHMPECVSFTRPEGGLFIWVTLPDGLDSSSVVSAALERKVAVVPGTAFNCDVTAPSSSFRLNYSMPSDEEIVTGISRLSDAVKECI
ncbi:MAG: PLP-dependent aminotransferase family protein [Clostridiales bacterium]|nr:PLP-dependent aminotransferase family protein [Clostridiales bacterium]